MMDGRQPLQKLQTSYQRIYARQTLGLVKSALKIFCVLLCCKKSGTWHCL